MWHRDTQPVSMECSGGSRRLVIKQEVSDVPSDCEGVEKLRDRFNSTSSPSKYSGLSQSQSGGVLVLTSDNEMYQGASGGGGASQNNIGSSGTGVSATSSSTTPLSSSSTFSTSTNGGCTSASGSNNAPLTSTTSSSNSSSDASNTNGCVNNGLNSIISSSVVGAGTSAGHNDGSVSSRLDGKHLEIPRNIPPPYAPRRPKIPLMNWNHVPSVR